MKYLIACWVALMLAGCQKVGVGGVLNQLKGDWAEVHLPKDCIAKQISAEENAGVAVLCMDGRVFH